MKVHKIEGLVTNIKHRFRLKRELFPTFFSLNGTIPR
jgi:hypothetical protein